MQRRGIHVSHILDAQSRPLALEGGLKGKCVELAMSPTRTVGAFSHIFDTVMGLDTLMADDWYKVQVPMHSKYCASPVVRPLVVKPAYEALAEEVGETPTMFEQLQSALPDQQMHPFYTEQVVGAV